MANLQKGIQPLTDAKNSGSDFWLLKFAAASVASLTLILVLLGFGVSLAVETKLALPHSSLYESSVELMDLGTVAVIAMVPKLFNGLEKLETYFEMIAGVWHSLWIVILLYVISVTVVFYLKYVKKVDIKTTQERAKVFLAERGKRGYLTRAGLFLLLLFASTLSPVFLYFGLCFALVILALVPLIGYLAGLAYVDEVAINNHACAPLPSVRYYETQKVQQAAKEQAKSSSQTATVQCVKVSKDGDEVASGRLVLSTSTAVVLYLPNGLARRVPFSDAVIEVVDNLPASDVQAPIPKVSQEKSRDKGQ